MAKKYGNFVNGKFVKHSSKHWIKVRNPWDQKVLAWTPDSNRKDIIKAIEVARKTFDAGVWSDITPSERSLALYKLADLLEKNLNKFAKLETQEQGKTIKQSTDSDFPFTVDNIRYFAGAARHLEGKASAEYAGLGTSIIRREPLGVVCCVSPSNYPLFVSVWQAIPALAAGNTVVIKPAEKTPLTLLEFAKLTQQAGIPNGVFNVVCGDGKNVAEVFSTHPAVDMVAVTAGTHVGRSVMELAAGTVKRVHLELGGKAPFIVLPDADLDAATEGAIVAGFLNAGQDCTAGTRFYVHSTLHDKFVKLLVQKVKKVKQGNPMNRSTDMGPLVSLQHRDRVEQYIRQGVKEGAKLVYGGHRPKNKSLAKGSFLVPAILTNVKQKSTVCQQEIFGPVLAVLKYKTINEVIEKANDVVYGLGSSIWGKDITQAMRIAKKLKFGEVWINDHGILASEMPHGGYKQSGGGKDLSMYSMEEYTQIKHVYIDLTGHKRKEWYYTVFGKPGTR